jgi:hypothetical protein
MFPAQEPEKMIELGLNQPSPQVEVPAAETLQFRTAIPDNPEARHCLLCSEAIPGEYFHVGGQVTCPRCAQARLADQTRTGGWPAYGRAALFGMGAAIAGSLLFVIVSLATHFRFGLLAIVVGVMVGKAVVMGARGCRGRRYQVLAVLLTYGAISTSYMPEIVTGFSQAAKKLEAKQQAEGKPARVSPSANPVFLLVGVVVIFAFSLAAPFLLLAQGTGFFGLIIIAIGLREAWKRTAADTTPILGPYPA